MIISRRYCNVMMDRLVSNHMVYEFEEFYIARFI